MKSSPVSISIILPVWNCPHYVAEAINSVLLQTFTDFELIIIDDGSTDNTPDVLKQFSDPRIRLVTQTNKGLPAALNAGLSIARGRFIARQDQDDFSLPERLALQFAYMETRPDCAMLGTWAQIYREDRPTERFHRHPQNPLVLRYLLLFDNPFVHSSVMIRRDLIQQLGGYSTDPNRQPPEDYELWSRLARVATVANLPRVLLHYREIQGSMSRQGASPFRKRLVDISAENLAAAVGINPVDTQCRNIAATVHGAHEMFESPDYTRMQQILREAAFAVCGDPLPAQVEWNLQSRLQHIQSASKSTSC